MGYDPSQPRDEKGRWVSEGVGGEYRTQVIEEAKKEHRKEMGYSFDDRLLEQAVDEGIIEGDEIHVGGGLKAKAGKGTIEFWQNEKQMRSAPWANMTREQKHRLRVLKAVQRSRKGVSTGTPWVGGR
jgi:hypothetical protein